MLYPRNHEFDYGSQRTQELMDKSTFCWLGSNIRNASDNSIFHTTLDTHYFDLFNADGEAIRVGVFGVCTQNTPFLSYPTNAVVFEDVVEHSNRCVNILRVQNNCHIVVALTHVGLDVDKIIAAKLNVDAIIGGHDHDPYVLMDRGTVILKTGQDIKHLGILDIEVEILPQGDVSVSHSVQLVATKKYPSDPYVDSIITKWNNTLPLKHDASIVTDPNEVVCVISDGPKLSTLSINTRSRETAFACAVADAMLASYADYGCDVALINGGFIRGNMEYDSGMTLLRSHIQEELPFPRVTKLIEITGQDLWRGLEQMISSSPHPVGSFPHLSAGFNAKYDLCKPPLERISEVMVNNKPIALGTHYKVAVSEFYIDKEADNVSAFQKEVFANHGKTIGECFIKYFQTQNTIRGVNPSRFVPVIASLDISDIG